MTVSGAAELVRQLASAKGRARYGRYVIEGTRHVERALRAGVTLNPVLVGAGFLAGADARSHALLAELHAAGCEPIVADDALLAELTADRRLGAICAVAPLPAARDLAALLAAAPPRPLLLAAVDVIEPGNLGALARTAHALGAAAFLLASQSDPYNPKAVRTAMGSLFKLPIVRYRDGDTLLDDLQTHGVYTLGAASRGGDALPALGLPAAPVAVVLGGEFYGLSADHQHRLDRLVTIPMAGGVDSLSVNAAAAILLYTVAQQASVTVRDNDHE